MQQLKVQARQLPEAIVESGDDVYVGKVAPRLPSEKYAIGGVAGLMVMPVRTTVDVGDVAQLAFARAIGSAVDLPASSEEAIDRAASDSGFNAALDAVRTSEERGPDHFEDSYMTGLFCCPAITCEVAVDLSSGPPQENTDDQQQSNWPR